MTLNLDGLIPATVLPMHEDGSIDEPTLRSYIAWVAEQGPVALAINVDTGEGPHLTHDEKVRIISIIRDVTDLPIIAGLSGPSTDAAVRQARDFQSVKKEVMDKLAAAEKARHFTELADRLKDKAKIKINEKALGDMDFSGAETQAAVPGSHAK